MRSTIFDNSANEKTAAAEMLKTPEMVVASRMESSVELILSPEIMQQSCKLKHRQGFSANRCNESATENVALLSCSNAMIMRGALRSGQSS